MRIFRHFNDLPADVRGAAVAIGNFDGVHRGHQAVIGEAGKIARATGSAWAVLTFEPHPRSVFQPDGEPFRLTPFRTKARHMEAQGVEVVIVQHFDIDFSRRPGIDFINDVLVGGLGVSHIIAGHDFVFGHGRDGDCDLLSRVGKEQGFEVTPVLPVLDDSGQVYSSTRVRHYLRDGDAVAASAILGRPFEIDGRVEHGDARGHTIGFPTANLHLGEYLCPARGVYAIRAGIDEGEKTRWIGGVANLGVRPTFDGEGVVLEAHLFDFDEDLYGRHLRVALIEYLRPEMKFDGVDQLKAQIKDDCDRARRILAQQTF